jgi:hypothetical protein
MDVEVELGRRWWGGVAAMAAVVLVGLTLLGRAVTPEGGVVLTPEEWRLLKASRAYDQELGRLRDEAGALVDILNRSPDAVRASAAADRVAQMAVEGNGALALQREALASAAEAVRLWAMGGAERQGAAAALQEAVDLLGRGE